MSQTLFSLLLCCYSQFVSSQMIIQPPQNRSVCEGGTVDFTCIVMFTSRIPSAAIWVTDNGNMDATTLPGHTRTDDSNGRSAPANVTNVLTVTNVSISDNRTDYLCTQGINVRSDTVFLTVLALPMTAPTVTVTPLNSTSFAVSWTITDPDHNYIITWTNLHTDIVDNMTVAKNTNSYTVTRLSGMDNYDVIVAANNSCEMISSDPTDAYGPPSSVPMNIRFPNNDITSESFIVEWNPVDDIFSVNYIVRWQREDGDDPIKMYRVDGLSFTVTNLTPNTSYFVNVTANNTCCGEGENGTANVTTNMRPPTPPPATTITTSITTSILIPTSPGGGDSDGDGSSTGIIIGVVVGVIVAIIVVILFIVLMYWYCSHGKDSTDSDRHALKSPTSTGGSHTASVQPSSQSSVPHQTADSGAEYAVATKVNTTTKTSHQPTEEYAMVDKNKKHTAATQGITYADLQALPSSGDKPIGNQGPTATYAQVA